MFEAALPRQRDEVSHAMQGCSVAGIETHKRASTPGCAPVSSLIPSKEPSGVCRSFPHHDHSLTSTIHCLILRSLGALAGEGGMGKSKGASPLW